MIPGIKLVSSDLDGTLLDSAKKLPDSFEQFVISHEEIRFVIASGRQYFNIIDLFSEAKDRLVFIAENGGLIFENGNPIHVDSMREDDVKLCIDRFNVPGKSVVILCGMDSAYMLKSSSQASFDNSYLYYNRLKMVDDFENINDRILKIAIYIEGNKADEVYSQIGMINDRLDALLSGVCWIDIANKTVSKGNAIRIIQEKFGISRNESMAFGDYLNDSSLLLECEESYAMSNAHPYLREIAKHIAPSNDDNGVMKVLRSLDS